MHKLVVVSALAAVLASPALAASWQEFDYPDAGFTVTFLGEPKLETTTYKTGGVSLPERDYFQTADSRDFRMQVIDFSSTTISKSDAIKQAVSAWTDKGQVLEDTFARINNDFGRNINVIEKDGSHKIGSIYFVNRKLYLVAGTSLPSDKDPMSSALTRFRESLSFLDDPNAPPPPAGGRGGGRGGGRRGPPPDGAAPPAP